MEQTYRVLCLFILTSELFRLNAASNLLHSHHQRNAHNRITHSAAAGRYNSTEMNAAELRRHQHQSVEPALVQRPHQIRHYHHHHQQQQHPSKHNKPSAYHHQSDDTAHYNQQRTTTEHFVDAENLLAAAHPGVAVQQNDQPHPSTQGPNVDHHSHQTNQRQVQQLQQQQHNHHHHHHQRYNHHLQHHQRQRHQLQHNAPTRRRPNSIDETRTTKKQSRSNSHGSGNGNGDATATDNGMLVPLRINLNNDNSNNNHNNSNNNNSINRSSSSSSSSNTANSGIIIGRTRNNSHRTKGNVPAINAVAPLETIAFRASSSSSQSSHTNITPVRDICFIFNLPKHCGMRLSSNSNRHKPFPIQSDAGNSFDIDANTLDVLAANKDDDDDEDDDDDDDDGMDFVLPTTARSAFNERHLRSNKRSQRDGHSSRSTSNNLNFDEKSDSANDDGWNSNNNHQHQHQQHHGRRPGPAMPLTPPTTTRATAFRGSMLNLNDGSIIPGELTKHKFETLGTHAGVAQARDESYVKTHNMRNSTIRNLARQHAEFIDREALCKIPRPRVINVPAHPAQSYMPPCTILHRCTDDTGCCKSPALKCVPKQYEIVTLYFMVSTIRGQGFIEEKHFHNHTECHCIDKALSSEPMLKPKCQCPNKFDVSYNGDNQCVCDCLESNRSNECISKKAGIEHFSMEDRRCILSGICTAPTCLHGVYNRTGGGCPQRDID